jgi:CRISPR-associated protein Cmr5
VNQLQTRAQRDLALALKCVQEMHGKPAAKIYGGLCHSFPVLVRQAGLCQAVAFAVAKSSSPDSSRAQAFAALLEHLTKALEVQGNLLDTVQTANAVNYMHSTRRLLAVMVYFKRFATSILKVEAGQGEKAS